jgi:hypothetical protein
MNSVALGDAFRLVTIIELAIVGGLASAILGIYLVANRHIARIDAKQHGVLTRHVIAISISYGLLAAFGIVELQGYYGTDLTFRAPIGFIAANFGIYAMIEMLRFQNARLDRRDRIVHVEGTPHGNGH